MPLSLEFLSTLLINKFKQHFIFCFEGCYHQTDGRQVQASHSHSSRSGPHLLHSHGRRLQYSSFEDLHRLSEEQNPFESNPAGINITVPIGDTAFLRCKVRSITGERSVSDNNN